jgi:hypothetical protein
MDKNDETKTDSPISKITIGVLITIIGALIIGAFSVYVNLVQRVTALETKVVNIEQQRGPAIKNSEDSIPGEKVSKSLVTLIKTIQGEVIRKSYGTDASECFTDSNMSKFIKDKVIDKITNDLSNDATFIKLVGEIKKLPSDEIQKIKSEALKTYSPLKSDVKEGIANWQTSAGQEAEKMVARAVVALVEKLMR